MISRYTSAAMSDLWSDGRKLEIWTAIEQVVLDQAHGLLVELPRVGVIDVLRHERYTRHDVAGFLAAIRDKLHPQDYPPEVYRNLHLGLTSSDLVDSCDGIRMRESNHLINLAARGLWTVLGETIERYGDVMVPGRTHGRYAEPMPLGHPLRGWQLQCYRWTRVLWKAEFYGKMSGATGQNLCIDEETERKILRQLGLHRPRFPSQIVPRWLYDEWYNALAGLAGLCVEIANWIRLGSIEGIDELAEFQIVSQVGSTAMPHKHSNPIGSERIVGLGRHAQTIARELQAAGHELWWQRDLTHSGLERMLLPDLCALSEFITSQTATLLNTLVLHPEVMSARAEFVPSSVTRFYRHRKEEPDVDQPGDREFDRREPGADQPDPERASAPDPGHDDQDAAWDRLASQ